MEPFVQVTGIAAPLDRVNVDTDQIMPKQFLKRIERTGFGEYTFFDWRFRPDGAVNPDFELNNPAYAGASILIAGRNFGCGSSREHAPWGLQEYGFRALIAPSFADIFANNCAQNGILTVVLPEQQVQQLMQRAQAEPGSTLTVDLDRCEVIDGAGFRAGFNVDPFVRHRLLNGLDDISLTLQHEDEIGAYEQRGSPFVSRSA